MTVATERIDNMLLWIDDLRTEPGNKWTVAKTSAEAIEQLAQFKARRDAGSTSTLFEISFDHDLGGDDTTRPVMLWMIENDVWPNTIMVHSANPVGVRWLVGMAERYAPEGTQILR